MKPPPFEYHAAHSVDEALALLREHGDDAKVLAGGQSLIPLLNFRLAQPAVLVDVNRVTELDHLREEPAGAIVRVGALTRQAAAERSAMLADRVPLLRRALAHVAHPQIRNRGTVGGSVAHADPAAEIPVALVASDATMVARRNEAERRIAATDFFVSHLTTSLEDDELLVAVEIPTMPERSGAAFEEYARRDGDYAVGGAAAVLSFDDGGACTRARIALLAASDVPLRAHAAEALLVGRRIASEAAREAAAAAVSGIHPMSTVQAGADYRRSVIEAMCERAILAAAKQIEEG